MKFNFTDPAGEPVKYAVIAGVNGSGKTTLLNSIYAQNPASCLYLRAERQVPDDFGDLRKLNELWNTFSKGIFIPRIEGGYALQREGDLIPIDQLSGGERAALALLIPVIQTDKNTILIDDAERSLHPTWCCKIIRILRKEPHVKQLIVATNANDLWDDGMSWERHHLGWR